jgi:transcriptional regulator with XRE-family HTH domain
MEKRARPVRSDASDVQSLTVMPERLRRAFGSRITLLRRRRGWSQRHLADRLGKNTSTVCRYETGASEPGLETLLRLAEVFEMDLARLVYGPAPKPRREDESA